MTTLTKESIEQKFVDIEHRIIFGGNVCNKVSHLSWNGIVFIWQPQAHKNGGTIKRYKAYGNIHYYYCDKELTRLEAINEVSKPLELRQAIIEAEAVIECSMCGRVVVGKEALDAHTSFFYEFTPIITIKYLNRCWATFFYKYKGDTGNISDIIRLTLCPNCMDNIANGKFRKV